MAPWWSLLEKFILKSYMVDSLKFQVVSGTNKPLLSAETCQKLRLLKFGSQTEVLTLDVKQAPLR